MRQHCGNIVTLQDYEKMQLRVLRTTNIVNFSKTTFIVTHNVLRRMINQHAVHHLAHAYNVDLITQKALFQCEKRSSTPIDKFMSNYLFKLDDNKIEHLPLILNIFVGMRVKLMKNIFIEIGPANGLLGTVHQLITDGFKNLRTILPHMFDTSFDTLPRLGEKIIPINPYSVSFTVKLKIIVT